MGRIGGSCRCDFGSRIFGGCACAFLGGFGVRLGILGIRLVWGVLLGSTGDCCLCYFLHTILA